MYKKSQEFQARFERIASSSALPTHNMQNAILSGNARAEIYDKTNLARKQLRALLEEVITERRLTHDKQRSAALFRIEKNITHQLSGLRMLRPKSSQSVAQHFMDVAESMPNHDVFLQLKEAAVLKSSDDARNRAGETA